MHALLLAATLFTSCAADTHRCRPVARVIAAAAVLPARAVATRFRHAHQRREARRADR